MSAHRLSKPYRLMWNEDGGTLSFYNPPMTPDQVAQAHFGFLEGTPVDAYMAALGNCCGYTTMYPTAVHGMEFIVDRLEKAKDVASDKGVSLWRYAENVRLLHQAGHDVLDLLRREARRLNIAFWFQLRMNDWHHGGPEGKLNLLASDFYADHPEFLIGKEGAAGWPDGWANSMALFQDYAHPEVRQLRLDLVAEACSRYDVDGFEYDFMRCPGFFKFGQEQTNLPVMTDFIRRTRAILDRIGAKRNRPLGLSVRVPNTVEGARRLGLDVPAWIDEHLVDIVVPSTFFNADLEEDVSEWVELARGRGVRINPAIEEGYQAGHTGGLVRCFYNPPVMLPLSIEMAHAIAARHWANGADGLYLFNWFGTAATYNLDNRSALDNIGDPLRLRHTDKRYVVMRYDGSCPNCLPQQRQLSAALTSDPTTITIDVADDLPDAADRLRAARLSIHLTNLTVADALEVVLNGQALACDNPNASGAYSPTDRFWQHYDLMPTLPRKGRNEITLRLARRNPDLADLPVELQDVELELLYNYPNGRWLGLPSH